MLVTLHHIEKRKDLNLLTDNIKLRLRDRLQNNLIDEQRALDLIIKNTEEVLAMKDRELKQGFIWFLELISVALCPIRLTVYKEGLIKMLSQYLRGSASDVKYINNHKLIEHNYNRWSGCSKQIDEVFCELVGVEVGGLV